MSMECLKEKLEKQLILLDNVYNIWVEMSYFYPFYLTKCWCSSKKLINE